MAEHLKKDAGDFELRSLVGFDRLYNLNVEVLKDECGLLYPVADFLATNDVNLRYFRADKDDLGGLDGLPEVQVFAQLEVPPSMTEQQLRDGLELRCPAWSRVTLREVWKRSSGDHREENRFVVKMK
ncbi:hypothetical protein FRUB_06335 [Fimbriiglobus ruber]|uniref:Uncharacterized protein n=2 Tax=Fimbriiglobus ruber TaxID=1908690 RepID=A0A225DP32_9BACT|nr:hypothetical protein FRUB_06335 [Fimbriiglobus ruber]